MTPEDANKLGIIAGYIGHPLTDEQMEFASDFTKDTISFSDPGTGKTHTLVAGLIMAQKYRGVPGTKINCMSFTNAAVSEIAGRYEKLCKACSISPTVKFNTFHALSLAIMADAYPDIATQKGESIKTDVADLTEYMTQLGYNVTDDDFSYVRKVLRAINTLNSALIFHPANLEEKYQFVELGMDLDDFQSLRQSMFIRGLVSKTIHVGDIPLYCLYALMKKKEMVQKWRGKYDIMVVDEFQDLSLLHLHILSYIAKTLIVIGDMKQQIYGFNGACPQIVAEYQRMHPGARICNLTESFRCGQAISDFATQVILPNDLNVKSFGGHNRGSSVNVMHRRDLDWKDIIKNIATDKKINGYGGMRDVMFLYRNNASAIPIIEELHKHGLPYRCSRMAKIMDVPVFRTLSKLCNAAWQPSNTQFCSEALRMFPEFRRTPYGMDPAPVQAMKASGKDLFSLNYRYREQSSTDILLAMAQASKAIEDGKNAGIVYMKLMEVYDKYLYKLEWWEIDNDKEFYFNLVAPICNSKPYPIMWHEEYEKESDNEKAIKANFGIRCYTMHSAKGLEADDVYILDCDEGKFPNIKVMGNKIKANCFADVISDIRSERNLLYVAITRAKYNVYISYSGAEVTKLIGDPDNKEYRQYDEFYNPSASDYDDADEFYKLFKIGDYAV